VTSHAGAALGKMSAVFILHKVHIVSQLKGIRVLDLGTVITAPLASMMLADLGADVIKVEKPQGGDTFRSFNGGLYSPYFLAFNRNKRSLTLDLRKPEGREIMEKLLVTADVMVENYRPGVMDRLGMGSARLKELNPRLIHATITGFGNDGPYADRPAFDTVGQALSGMANLFIDAQDPRLRGPTIVDNVTGMNLAYGVLGALFERERTGVARRVEVNMLESAIGFMPDVFANFTQTGTTIDAYSRVAASQSYACRCADGKMLAVHLSSQEKFWQGLTAALERPDLAADPRFATRMDRFRHYQEVCTALAEAFITRERAYWMPRLQENDVPFAPIHTVPEVFEDPQVKHLGSFYDRHHPTEGAQRALHRPVAIDGEREQQLYPPPVLGEHTDEVLREIGCDEARVAALRKSGVV
jgi:crotonobetainyl-CoA:carnitine CoA-transferase CaiB-like acyl-CoA transferase